MKPSARRNPASCVAAGRGELDVRAGARIEGVCAVPVDRADRHRAVDARSRFRRPPRPDCPPRTRCRRPPPRTRPAPTAYRMASSTTNAGGPERPMLMLTTLAPRRPRSGCRAPPCRRCAKLGAPNRKSQTPSMTLTGINRTLNATPAVPIASFVIWPMVPLTCVPWPSKSSGVSSSQMKSYGDTIAGLPRRVHELIGRRVRDRHGAERWIRVPIRARTMPGSR